MVFTARSPLGCGVCLGIYRLFIVALWCGVVCVSVCVVLCFSLCFVVRVVLWVIERRCVWSRAGVFSSFSSSSSLLLVFGVVRAQPCEHARYPRTPLCSLVVLSSLSSSFTFRFSLWNGGGCLPCVGVLCWHDGYGESVSFVLVFLVVAGPAFSVSAVAASAVAFGAEDSAVVWVIGSA